ncbi:MAG: FMN-binding protein [bacterium]|nr:FMN-binding protein [bacterium]
MKNREYNMRWSLLCGAVMVCLVVAAACEVAQADKIVLKNNATYNGVLVKKTASTIKFRVIFSNGAEVVLDFPANKIKSITVGGDVPQAPERPKPKPPQAPQTPKTPKTPSSGNTQRSTKAIKALIQREGKTLPGWWDSVKLDYPRTLDLAGTKRARGWQPRINLGAYFYTLVTPYPARWKPGIKLLAHVVGLRKNDPRRQAETIAMLANYYHHYLEDYPRAAYWYLRNDRPAVQATVHGVAGLAECYLRMGNKKMAAALLAKYGMNERFSSPGVKLLAELGQRDKALKLAMSIARVAPDQGYLAAGNLHRLGGKYDQAINCYAKAAASQTTRGHAKLNKQRARECLEAVKLYKTLDISKVADGTHRGSSASYRGPLNVELKVSGGRITSAKVSRHKDDIFFTSITKIPKLIVTRQSVEGIDAVSGATVTCEAIVNASTKALSSGMK